MMICGYLKKDFCFFYELQGQSAYCQQHIHPQVSHIELYVQYVVSSININD